LYIVELTIDRYSLMEQSGFIEVFKRAFIN